MPYFSGFTPFGHLEFGARASASEQSYDALARFEGGAFALDEGTDTGAETYATAMMLGDISLTLDRAKNQRDPMQANLLIEVREKNFNAVPTPGITLDQRRQQQAARERRSTGGTSADIIAALTDLLGSDFVAYRPIKTTERTLEPADPTTTGIFSRADIPPNVFTLLQPVTFTGVPVTTAFAPLRPTDTLVYPTPGTKLVVDASNRGMREVVTVTGAVLGGGFTATFTKSHDVGAICTTGPFPTWTSDKRQSLVVVSASAAQDIQTRRQISLLMAKYARGVSTWSIVEESTPGSRTTGPFIIGQSLLGTTTLGVVTDLT